MVGVGERHPTVGAVRPQGEGVIEIGHSATIGTFGGAPARYVAGRMPGAGPGRSVVDVMTQPRPTRTGCPPAPTRWLPFAAVGTVVTLFVLAVTAHLDAETGGRGLDVLGVLLIVAGGVSIGLSPRWPRVAFAIDAAAIVGYVALGFPNGPFLVTVLITLGVMSRLTDRRTALIGAAALCAALALAELVRGGNNWFLPVVFIGWSAGAVFLGEVLRTRRTRSAELQERARTLERTREEEARRRVAEDRLQIARDLHDGVAHAMATINVQAGAAAHVMDRHPEAAKDALGGDPSGERRRARRADRDASALLPRGRSARRPRPDPRRAPDRRPGPRRRATPGSTSRSRSTDRSTRSRSRSGPRRTASCRSR